MKNRGILVTTVSVIMLGLIIVPVACVSSDTFLKFLRCLIKDAARKVFLIVDNLRVHHATKVRKWVEAHVEKIELFSLPPYSPEHNPDEYLNHDVKTNVRNNPAPRSGRELIKAFPE